MTKYTGRDLAPYWRFRPTRFYGSTFPNGTYTADVMGCNWTCDHCWSKFGWRTVEAKYELSSDQVVEKLLKGMHRNNMPWSRISGGESSMYWRPHMFEVIRLLLTETDGELMKVPGRRAKHDMGIVVETNGSMAGKLLDELVAAIPNGAAERLLLSVGVKATNPDLLRQLTGHTPRTAARFHQEQIDLLRYLSRPECEIQWSASFIDQFTDEDELEHLRGQMNEIGGEGTGDALYILPFKTTGWGSQKTTTRHYTPRRHQEGGST